MQNGDMLSEEDILFESFVNSERCKTCFPFANKGRRLRALLIQKDAKHLMHNWTIELRLRALLIQKDAKQARYGWFIRDGLRALLIQKDAKLLGTFST